MQYANPVLPARSFTIDTLLPPHQAIVAFLSRVDVVPGEIERVTIDDALGRVLACPIAADDDYPNAPRSAMDGFAVVAQATPGTFNIAGHVRMGDAAQPQAGRGSVLRIPTGGVLPTGADAVVPVEEAQVEGDAVSIAQSHPAGDNVIERAADMKRGDVVLPARRRLRAVDIGVLATLGVSAVPVYRRPVIAVLSTGDELVGPEAHPEQGQVRDSNRYAVSASLRAMGAQPRHYPTLPDETDAFEAALRDALNSCDAVVVTGGSSVGERDRLPWAVHNVASPGIVVHGLRVKPGKPTLLGADGPKPILGLPGNPASALLILEAVAAPIVAALTGAVAEPATVAAHLGGPAHSRAGWTWYVPVRLQHDGRSSLAHPLPLRSFSVSVLARADGFIIMDERDEVWPAGAAVTVYRFLGG